MGGRAFCYRVPRIEACDRNVLLILADESVESSVRASAQAELENTERDPDEPADTYDVCEFCYLERLNTYVYEEDLLEHPPYEYWLGPKEPYTCAVCGQTLTEEDN